MSGHPSWKSAFFRKRAEYCFESTVSEKRTHWVLRQTRWVLRKTRWVRFGTQIIGWEELTEFSGRNSVSPEKLTELGVWNRTPRNRVRPISDFWAFSGLFLPFWPFSGESDDHPGSPETTGKRHFSSDNLGFPKDPAVLKILWRIDSHRSMLIRLPLPKGPCGTKNTTGSKSLPR